MPKALAALLPALLASPALAQLSALEPKAPPPLPDPPTLPHYLLESPLLVIAVLVIAAGVSYAALNSAGKSARARQSAAALAALALCVWTAAYFVKTPREEAISITKQLVADVAAGNTRAVDAALASKAAIYSDQSPQGQSKDIILSKVDEYFGPRGQAPIQEHAILEAQALITNPSLAQVQIKVRVTVKGGYPVLSWWQLDLVPRFGGGWEVSGVKYLSSNFPLPL